MKITHINTTFRDSDPGRRAEPSRVAMAVAVVAGGAAAEDAAQYW